MNIQTHILEYLAHYLALAAFLAVLITAACLIRKLP